MKNNGKMKETSPHAEMDERIALFLRGGMSETEAQAFRAEMKENPKLRERAVLMARLIKQMRKVGKEREQHLVDALQTVDRKTIEMIAKGKGMETMKERKPLMRRLMPWAAAAAIICCVALVGRYVWITESAQISNFAYELICPQASCSSCPGEAIAQGGDTWPA